MESVSSEGPRTNPSKSSRFSISSLLSIRTLPPQYTAVDVLEETALAANAGCHGPSSINLSRTSSSGVLTTSESDTTRSSRNRLSRWSSIRTLPPQYSAVDVLEERASTASTLDAASHGLPPYAPNIRTSPSADAMGRPREVVLTWSSSTTARPCDISEFQYSYPIRPKKPWATLHLRTRDAIPGNPNPLQNHPRVPRFWSCEPIVGSLQLDLDGPHNIQQIIVSV